MFKSELLLLNEKTGSSLKIKMIISVIKKIQDIIYFKYLYIHYEYHYLYNTLFRIH